MSRVLHLAEQPLDRSPRRHVGGDTDGPAAIRNDRRGGGVGRITGDVGNRHRTAVRRQLAGDRQTEPGPAGSLLVGREERLEDVGHVLALDP